MFAVLIVENLIQPKTLLFFYFINIVMLGWRGEGDSCTCYLATFILSPRYCWGSLHNCWKIGIPACAERDPQKALSQTWQKKLLQSLPTGRASTDGAEDFLAAAAFLSTSLHTLIPLSSDTSGSAAGLREAVNGNPSTPYSALASPYRPPGRDLLSPETPSGHDQSSGLIWTVGSTASGQLPNEDSVAKAKFAIMKVHPDVQELAGVHEASLMLGRMSSLSGLSAMANASTGGQEVYTCHQVGESV